VAKGRITFLFDNNLPPSIPRALDALGELARHVRFVEELGEHAADAEWLEFAGKQGWCVISQDLAILKRVHERAAIARHQVGTFFLAPAITGRCDIIQTLIRHWPAIKTAAHDTPRPFILGIYRNGVRRLKSK
jgi:hypothetical protein